MALCSKLHCSVSLKAIAEYDFDELYSFQGTVIFFVAHDQYDSTMALMHWIEDATHDLHVAQRGLDCVRFCVLGYGKDNLAAFLDSGLETLGGSRMFSVAQVGQEKRKFQRWIVELVGVLVAEHKAFKKASDGLAMECAKDSVDLLLRNNNC